MPKKKASGSIPDGIETYNKPYKPIPQSTRKPLEELAPLPRRGQFQPKTFDGAGLESAIGKGGISTPSSLLGKRRQRGFVR
jgi:hypothetical protein